MLTAPCSSIISRVGSPGDTQSARRTRIPAASSSSAPSPCPVSGAHASFLAPNRLGSWGVRVRVSLRSASDADGDAELQTRASDTGRICLSRRQASRGTSGPSFCVDTPLWLVPLRRTRLEESSRRRSALPVSGVRASGGESGATLCAMLCRGRQVGVGQPLPSVHRHHRHGRPRESRPRF